jgi:chemotaxis signal transduction protein
LPPLKVISFIVKDRYFALPSRQVKEIIESEEEIKPLFYGGGLLKGLVNYNGELVSVLNLPLLLDIPGPVKCPSVLVCRDKESGLAVAITVSEIVGIERVGVGRIESISNAKDGYVKGFIRPGRDGKGNRLALIDLEKIAEMGLEHIKEDNGFSYDKK